MTPPLPSGCCPYIPTRSCHSATDPKLRGTEETPPGNKSEFLGSDLGSSQSHFSISEGVELALGAVLWWSSPVPPAPPWPHPGMSCEGRERLG